MRNAAASGRYGTIIGQGNRNERIIGIMQETNDAAAAADANGGTAAGGDHECGPDCVTDIIDRLVGLLGPVPENLREPFGLDAETGTKRVGEPTVSREELLGALRAILGRSALGGGGVGALLTSLFGGRPEGARPRSLSAVAELARAFGGAITALAGAIEQAEGANVKGGDDDTDEAVDLGDGRKRVTLGARPYVLVELGDVPPGVPARPGAAGLHIVAGGGIGGEAAANMLMLAALGMGTDGNGDGGDDDEPAHGDQAGDEPAEGDEQGRPAEGDERPVDEPTGATQGDAPAGSLDDPSHGDSGPGGTPLPGVSPAGVDVPASTGGDAAHAA